MTTQLPCIVCGTTPEGVDEETDYHPYAATEFFSYGHYGSTVWDPMNGEQTLVLNVCDSCLKKLHDRLIERHDVSPRRTTYDYKPFEPYIPEPSDSGRES